MGAAPPVMADEHLMTRVRDGSQEAFETLFERHKDAVWRFFRRRLGHPARAEELVQDVFVAILRNAGRYEPRSAFRSYLFGIAYNLLKAERRKEGWSEVPCDVDPPAAGPDADATLWVQRALGLLDADHREVVMLREYEGLSYLEIAELLNIPVNTVRSRLFRARMDLKQALSREAPIPLKVGHESR
jgi:RNA polymerase sigma-70 factor (ECF subfamily)